MNSWWALIQPSDDPSTGVEFFEGLKKKTRQAEEALMLCRVGRRRSGFPEICARGRQEGSGSISGDGGMDPQ